MRPLLSLHTRRAPWFFVGGSTIVELPVRRSIRAMNELANEHHHTSPLGVVHMPYGPGPRGASLIVTTPLFTASLPTRPLCPVNHRSPSASKVAVFRLAWGVPSGSAKARTSRSGHPTRTMAPRPPSVIHAALSGPGMTPCGAAPAPSATSSVRPVRGSNQPRWPLLCAVNHTPPSNAGATSWTPVRCRVPSGQDCSTGDCAAPGSGTDAASTVAPIAPIAWRRETDSMFHLLRAKPRASGGAGKRLKCHCTRRSSRVQCLGTPSSRMACRLR